MLKMMDSKLKSDKDRDLHHLFDAGFVIDNVSTSSSGTGSQTNDSFIMSDQKEATTQRGIRRNTKISAFFSYLLFIMGSILYLVLAVKEYQWMEMVYGWPEYVLQNYSDDIIYNNYRLCLLFYGSKEAVEAAGCGASVDGMRRTRRMVEVGYYDEFGWDELPIEVQAAFVTLGYSVDIYDDPLGIGLKALSEDILDEGAATWTMCWLLLSADLMFLIGALTDVIVSYQQYYF
jgi:hypothetical protein